MTIRSSTDPTSAGRIEPPRSLALAAPPRGRNSRSGTALRANHRSGDAQWPHVGECNFAGIAVLGTVKRRDGGRVSAAGDAR